MAKSCALRTRYKHGARHELEVRGDELANSLTSATKDSIVLLQDGEQNEKGVGSLTKTDEVQTKNFNYVSLFSGIGGFEQALDKLGGNCVLASEIDEYAERGYKAANGHGTVGDIMEVDEKDVPEHDMLVGGFPCQAFSVAGNRGGFDDARGTMFFQMARIASEKQPKMVIAENVKGLVGHDKGKTLDTMVKALNDIGYRVDFNILNSKFFDVPQNRERIFIVGMREDLVENEAWEGTKGSKIVPKGKRRIEKYPDVKTFNFDWPSQTEVTTKLVDVLETKTDEKYYLSDEKTEQLIARLEDDDKADAPNVVHNIYGGFKEKKPRVFKDESPTIRTSAGGGHLPSLLEEGLPIREATQKGYKVAHEGDAVNFRFPNSQTRRGRIGKQCAQTLEATSINQGVVEKLTQHGVLMDRSKIGKATDISHCLMARDYKGFGNQEMTGIIEKPKFRIRKLTPLECFRLQGFDDDVHEAIKDEGISDSQRYKMAGNAVTVNVIEAIGEKALPYL